MEGSETLVWKIAFSLSLALAGALALICGCLVGGRHSKGESRQNAERFAQVLKHQAELWKEEREKREKEYELRLEEQRRKNVAWEQNSELRDDMNDVMEENRLLGEQKDELTRRSERLQSEVNRLKMANDGLAVQIAHARWAKPETVVEPETERPRGQVRFSPTLTGSGLPPGSTCSLEDAVKRGLDGESEPGTEPETERPRSKVRFSPTLIGSGLPPGSTCSLEDAIKRGPYREFEPETGLETVVEQETAVEPETERPCSKGRFSPTLIGSGLPPGSTCSLEDAIKSGLDSDSSRSDSSYPSFPSMSSDSEADTPSRTALPLSPLDNDQFSSTSRSTNSMMTMGGILPGPSQRQTWTEQPVPPLPENDIWKPASPG
ncbi:hypothetical protein CDV36_008066 [Fusarium kuroshium]|uniref:Uncharacterized protein n=1 Tax=Fusarium kuroshium TaxID=2010991 RepID=A0A3M2S3Z8_9HYPO|nr:hypothetical protein CDV36_008066 [Fusarium kuroshium]